uniref:NADH dehydrogenase subunit 2 n=1 Tax=Entemnotrochus adansonianus TaxID=121186 RepID=UPI001E76D4C6|nr:NADH dehydrogenase subunit 2 [Entemnotrochus adansonianus]UDL72143.1 NADH dehydrogenase subunit 2 [Entemnotrochus adansonianus]
MFLVMPYGFMFLLIMLFGTIFSISANHWLGIWAGLEINLMGFLPLLVYGGSISGAESSIKYFIIQASGSGLLMMGSLLSFGYSFDWEIMMLSNDSMVKIGTILLVCSLLLKLGSFPFYFWLPSVMTGLTWITCLLLATWQKVAPVFLLSCVIQSPEMTQMWNIMLLFALGGGVVGGLGGINQTQIRSLLAYSSISHIGWMLFCMLAGEITLKVYLIIYILVSVCVFLSLWALEISLFTQSSSMALQNMSLRLVVMTLLLSLAGMPPMLGFSSKWFALVSGMNNYLYISAVILLVSSVISLLYYLGLSFSMFFSASNSLNLNQKHTSQKNYNLSKILGLVLVVFMMVNMLGGGIIISDMYVQNFF